MADNNLAQMGDRELLKLFSITSTAGVTRRVKQVEAELVRRGYSFDPHQRDMIPCEEWNKRYPDVRKDCAEEARRRRRGAV